MDDLERWLARSRWADPVKLLLLLVGLPLLIFLLGRLVLWLLRIRPVSEPWTFS